MVILTRTEAGRRLALGLVPLVQQDPVVVVALSPGGIRVAAEIARLFEAPLDVLPACRLEVPGRPHSIFGAIVGRTVRTDPDRVMDLGLPGDYVAALIQLTCEEVAAEARAWRGGAPAVPVQDRTVILADDGAGEALQVTAAVQALRDAGARRVLFASPHVAAELAARMRALADGQLFLYEPGRPGEPLVLDPTFAQTTRVDVRNLVRRSRPDLAIVTGP